MEIFRKHGTFSSWYIRRRRKKEEEKKKKKKEKEKNFFIFTWLTIVTNNYTIKMLS